MREEPLLAPQSGREQTSIPRESASFERSGNFSHLEQAWLFLHLDVSTEAYSAVARNLSCECKAIVTALLASNCSSLRE